MRLSSGGDADVLISVSLLLAKLIKRHDQDQDDALKHADMHILEADHCETVVQNPKNQDSGQGSQDAALAAGKRRAAEKYGRNYVQLSAIGVLGHAHCRLPREEESAHRSGNTAHEVEYELHSVHPNAGNPGRSLVGADDVDLPPEFRMAEEEIKNDKGQDQQN